jgi:Ca-activated chloride channel family protein
VTFANPVVLVLAAAAPIVVVALYFYDRARRGQLTRRLGELPVIGKVIASASPRRRAIKAILLALALACVLVALARPRREGRREVELHGLDLVIALDVSKSMLVDDVEPTQAMLQKSVPATRLARARELVGALVDELPGDRIAPVVFANAAAHFPLTEDHEVAVRFLEELGPGDLPAGSNLAEALRVSVCLFYSTDGCKKTLGRRGHGGDPLPDDPEPERARDDDQLDEKIARGKAIVLVTDGGDPDEETLKEIGKARDHGIAVVVVGVGSQQGGIVHEIDYAGRPTREAKKTRDGQVVTSKRDDAAMTALAAAGGDAKRYIVANEHGEVDPKPIVDALRAVDRGLATKKITAERDVFQPFLYAAWLLLVVEAAIGTRRRLRFPEAS